MTQSTLSDDIDLSEPPEPDLPPPPEDDQAMPEPAEEVHPPALVAETSAVAHADLVELLPADFPLPQLIKFAPDTRLRLQADTDAVKLLSMQVVDEASKGVVEACLTQQRAHRAAITEIFREPCAIADR